MLHNHSLFNSNQSSLKIKLDSALRYVLHTCVLGADNKISDIEKTNGWVMNQRYRYHKPGQYIFKNDPSCVTPQDTVTNMRFDPETRKFFYSIKDWFYRTDNFDGINCGDVNLYWRYLGLNPLQDPRFSLSDDHQLFLFASLLIMEKKQGTCLEHSYLTAKYLWENHAGLIKSIEILSMKTFDHFLVAINREGELNNPATWGNGWLLDSWYEKGEQKGTIFPASQFKEKIAEIKQFAKSQLEAQVAFGFTLGKPPFQENEEFSPECVLKIEPEINQYPTYSTSPFYPVEYYYIVSNIYPRDLRVTDSNISPVFDALRLHQQKFKSSLQQIDKNPSSNSIKNMA